MSNYWKKRLDELNKEHTPDYWQSKMNELEKERKRKSFTGDIAPAKTETKTVTETKVTEEPKKEKWYNGFLQLGEALSDGYQFGDVTKTLLGTNTDIGTNLISGVVGWGEDLLDAGAAAVGTVTEKFGMEKATQKLKDFASKDQYDANEVSRKILSSNLLPAVAGPFGSAMKTIFTLDDWLNSKEVDNGFGGTMKVREDNSILGDETDALLQSTGEIVAKKGLQAAAGGIPIGDIITGVTVYGAQAEQALKEDATFSQATGSGLISAGAEILFEKLSGGIKIGGATLDDGLTRIISKNISNVALKNGLNLAKDIAGESLEEVLTEFVSKLGTKLYKEEDLGEILFSKESLNDYIHSAIAGGLMGGAFGAYESVGAMQAGRDYKSGLTENENKVFQKELEDRIAEEEKESGKKLTRKEKNELYEKVMNDVQKGYISTDKIESILGGETYKTYQDTIESEEKAIKELETLYEGDELTQAVNDILENSKRTELKQQLSREVSELAMNSKDSFLSESYNEAARRKEAFAADLAKYDTKTQEHIKKAIDSGVLNNTRRTHEFVDMIAKISTDKGVLFDYTNNAKLKESGFAVDGKSVNGFVTKDGVTVNIDSQKALNSIVGHEITHVLEGTEFYDALQETIFEYAKTKGIYDERLKDTYALYKTVDGYKGVEGFKAIKREVVSDLVGDYLFTDADFINNLSTKNRNVFQKVYDEIKYLCKIATAGSKEARELERVKHAFEQAYRGEGKANGDTKYSLSDGKKFNLADVTIDDVLKWSDEDFARAYEELGLESFVESDDDLSIESVSEEIDAEQEVIEILFRRNGLGASHVEDNRKAVMTQDRIDQRISEHGAGNTDYAKRYITRISPKDFIDMTVYEKNMDRVNFDSRVRGDFDGKMGDWDYEKQLRDSEEPPVLVINKATGQIIGHNGRHRVRALEMAGVESVEIEVELHDEDGYLIKYNAQTIPDLAISSQFDTAIETHISNIIPFNKAHRNEIIANYGEKAHANAGVKYSLSDSDGKQLTKEQQDYFKDSKMRDDNGKVIPLSERFNANNNDIRFSLSRNSELMQNAENANSKNLGIDLSTARQQRQEIYEYMTKNADRLKLPEDIEGNTAIKNSSYDITEENTTVCIRSMAADALCDAVAEELGRPLTVQDTLRISQDLMNYTDEPECVYCYVATDRKAYREFLGSYHKQMQSVIDELQSGKNSDDVYKAFLDGRKDTKNMRNRFAMWEKIANGGKMISAKDLASEKMMQNAMRDPELAAQVKDARAYAQSASWAKKRMGYQAYDGHILDWSQRRINDLNKHYGLRFYSFSDFSPAFVLENMQQMTDASVRGLKGLAYTKVLDFAEIFAPTGININISVFGYNQNGVVAQDGMMGADWNGAQDLRNRYENVGITFVATNDTQIEWALNQDWIDVVIPYHLVRTGQAVAKNFGYTNYTAESGDTKGANWKKGDKKTIYPSEHNNDKQTYLAALAEANLEPRFARWVNHPNYMKLVNETRRSANDTPPMKAEFNVDAAKASLDRMMKRGGYFVPIGGDYANMQDIASEIAGDIRGGKTYSLSAEGETPKSYGKYNVYGKDVRLETDIAPTGVNAGVNDTKRIADFPDDIAPMTEEETAEMQNERLDSISDLDAPPEIDAPYYEENETATPDDPFESRDIKDVGNQKVKAYMYENPEVKPFFQEEANVMLGELQRTTKGERWYNDKLYYETNGERGFFGTQRDTSADIAYLLDEQGYTYAEIEKGLKAIIEDNGKENNACSKRIEFLLNDRLLKGYQAMDGTAIPADENYKRLLKDKQIMEYNDEARKKFFEVADDFAPYVEMSEESKTEQKTERKRFRPEREKAADNSADEKIAKVLVDEPETPKKKGRTISQLVGDFVDKGAPVEKLALKTKNRELQAKYNFMHYSENRAQHYIKKNLMPLLDKIEKTGKTQEVFDYAYHLHNIDRMSIDTEENKAKREELRGKYFDGMTDKQIEATANQWITKKTTKEDAERIKAAREYVDANVTKNLPVFGDSVTADKSREIVKQYEANNPEFIEIEKEILKYNEGLRKLLVDNGVISQETSDMLAKKYPHYVPTRRVKYEGASISVPLDSRKTGVNTPIKRATGGNSDIGNLGKTMAMRTEQIFKAIARNNFGLELMHTLDSDSVKNDASFDDIMDTIDNQDELMNNGELLKKGENGKAPTFTVFENGKRVEFEITEELFDSMKPTSEKLAKALPTSKLVNAFKKLTTQYNLKFAASNPIKDIQDVLVNSQHPIETYANILPAAKEYIFKGKYYTERLENGGEQDTYFDAETKTFKDESIAKKVVLGIPRGISAVNDFFETTTRLAEYMASRKKGASIETAMLDSARVTTNFNAGGDVTKYIGRNFAPFLNPSVQGAVQQVRNVREAAAEGFTGMLKLAGKYAAASIPVLIFNALAWDDDEEYEELSDYVKENYYVVAKFDDGKFVRIPKGRTLSVLQSAVEQTINAIKGEEFDFGKTGKLFVSNVAPNNPLESNIFSTIKQIKTNKTWYGEDLVPSRLQDMPAAEQYDESTDLISKWLGEKLNVSPYQINYLIDQYSGGIGDMILPMLTPEAESGDNSIGGNLVAPWKDLFTTDSVMNNQNVSDFYDTVDELTKNANSAYATDEDILMSKYMNSVNAELGELYAQKREIQSKRLSDADKYAAVRDIQKQIDAITRESLNTYNNVDIDDGYATVGDLHYRTNKDGEWEKITDKQLEKQEKVTRGLGISASDYWSNKEEYDYAYDYPEKYAVAKSVGGYSAYKTYSSELYDIKADKDENGKSISGSRKEKVIEYINDLDADYGEKIILFKSEYNADDTYNYEIIDYLNSRQDISYEEMETILKELGFTVDKNGNISW